MTNIFVISQTEGDYESSHSWPVATTYDEQKAKDYVASMEKHLEQANAARNLIEDHMRAWQLANPRVPFKVINHTPPVFKGPEKKWTSEQTAEYNKYEKQYEKDREEAMLPLRKWTTKCYEERTRFSHTFPENIQQDLNLSSDATWDYDSIIVIE